VIYAVRFGHWVKIGCSVCPKKRIGVLAASRKAYPYRTTKMPPWEELQGGTEIFGYLNRDRLFEHELHAKLRTSHEFIGEYYRWSTELGADIAALNLFGREATVW
jgi:hypothetical protein